MTDRAVEGGCLCGAVRYRLARHGDDVAHCHCRICRRASGAAFVTWATVARDDLEVRGRVRWFRSSRMALRGSCPVCGSHLFFAQEIDESAVAAELPLADAPPTDPHGATTIDVTVATLDEPPLPALAPHDAGVVVASPAGVLRSLAWVDGRPTPTSSSFATSEASV